MPESGQGALGPSLVPVGQAYEDYRNHPMFTDKMSVFLKALLDREFRFEFPRLWSTKGQTLREYVSGHGVSPEAPGRYPILLAGQSPRFGQQASSPMWHLRRLHAAASERACGWISERKDTYIWEDLRAASFESGAAEASTRWTPNGSYAIAGTLHLDHLASLGALQFVSTG